MNIKSEEELAIVLGNAFTKYANLVQNGAVTPFLNLLKSSSVDVMFTVTERGEIIPKEFTLLMPTATESPSDTITEINVADAVPIVTEVKPKRSRRKKQKEVPPE